MVGAVEDEIVGADDGFCVLWSEMLPVWDILWKRIEPVTAVSAPSVLCVYKRKEMYSLQYATRLSTLSMPTLDVP